MTDIANVPLRDIDNNPHRHLDKYPYVEAKVEALMRSIEDVGFWEGVIGRRVGNRVQIAFGHHRIEAARRTDQKTVPIIMRDDLDDELMLKFMGRENGEDYNADFKVMLETWEAAVDYLNGTGAIFKDVDVARLLGWVQKGSGSDGYRMNHTARACANASTLMEKGAIEREDFEGVSVKAANEVATTAKKRIKQFEDSPDLTDKQKAARKKHVGEVAKGALKDVAAGNLSSRDAGYRANAAFRDVDHDEQDHRTMDRQLDSLAKSIENVLSGNKTADRLDELAALLAENYQYMNSADRASLQSVRARLNDLSVRAKSWYVQLDPANAAKPAGADNVVHLELKKEGK